MAIQIDLILITRIQANEFQNLKDLEIGPPRFGLVVINGNRFIDNDTDDSVAFLPELLRSSIAAAFPSLLNASSTSSKPRILWHGAGILTNPIVQLFKGFSIQKYSSAGESPQYKIIESLVDSYLHDQNKVPKLIDQTVKAYFPPPAWVRGMNLSIWLDHFLKWSIDEHNPSKIKQALSNPSSLASPATFKNMEDCVDKFKEDELWIKFRTELENLEEDSFSHDHLIQKSAALRTSILQRGGNKK